MTTTPDDGEHIDMTLEEYKRIALNDLNELSTMFDSPEFRAAMGDDLADGLKAVNDDKIREIEAIPEKPL